MRKVLLMPSLMVGMIGALLAYGMLSSGMAYTESGQTLFAFGVALFLFGMAGASRGIKE